MWEKKINEMKIHYVWDNWKIDYRLNLRQKLTELNEKDKIEIFNIRKIFFHRLSFKFCLIDQLKIATERNVLNNRFN